MPGNVRNTGQSDSHRPPITSASRTKSLDCLADKSDKTSEYVPSRITRTQPKIKADAMQFVKTGPAGLYKSATEQIKKAEAVKAMRKHLIAEEEDWQQNLDKWKSSRRKRNEDALERVIEIKKNEQEEELNRTRRKSKTFSEMQEDKSKRGRRYNLVVHDDDNNDLADLGLSTVKSSSSLFDGQEDNDVKDLDQDNKDAKSDAGFCTGSDTGSDGVFAEDNISDTSSALGDKKETHDSLLDTGVSKEEEPRINGHGSSLTSDILNTNNANLYTEEYTYDKAIEGYKQYAENTAKKRTSSITSLNSNTSFTKEDERKDERPRLNGRSPSPAKSNKLEEKLNFFTKEMVKESRTSPEPRVIMREKSPKVDVGKRRSMFEMGEPLISQSEREQKQANRRSLEVPGSLRNKVASFENLDMDTPKVRGMTPNIETNLKSKVKSFENLDTESTKVRGVTPTRDTKFREKLASFAAADTESQTVRKKTPERDVNFHKKLASFTSIENGEEEKCVERKTIPLRDPTLKNKIASFEQLEQAAEAYSQPPREEPVKNRDRSVSLENLDEPPPVKEVMRPAVSMGNMGLMRRAPSTPYMVVDLDKAGVEEESCIREKRPVVSDEQESAGARDQAKRSTIYETIEKCQVVRDVESAPMFSIFQYLSPEVGDEIQGEIEEPMNEPHYQTLEEVREEVSASVEPVAPAPPSPPQPVASKPPPVIEPPEVLDVTWTDGPSQAAPPCVPPPPPPPDDDSDDDASDQPQGLPEQAEDEPFTRENSTRRIKKELWRRRSDFLGTSSQYIEEEPTVKPPPDLSELLRQEREAERIMAESQRARTPIQETLSKAEIARREREIIESLERSEQLKQQQQQQSQYTWQEHMAEETTMTEEQKQLSEHLEYQVLMSVDRDSCPQGFSSVPPPPPSPVANPTHPCSSLAACMPSHSDLFTLSPLPEGDEVSGSASPQRVICSSPPPLPIAPPECGVPSLTPIPEGEEMATPSTTISEKSTPTSDVVIPSPSSPLAKISACTSANSMSPESVPCADSPRIMSPELTVTPSQDIAPSPVSSSAPTEHVNTDESVDQTAPTLSSVSDPIYTSYSSVTSTTYSLVDPNLQTDVNIQQPSESSPSVDEKEGAEVLQHSDNVSCDSVIANDTFESVLEASPSSEPCSSSPQPSADSTISHAHPDAEPSPSSPNSHLNSPGLLDPSEKPTAPDTQHITEPVNSDSHTVSSAPTVSALQSEKKSEKSSKEKTVRFNIDDECSDSSDDSLPLPSEHDSDASIDSKETVDTVVTDTQMKSEEEHVENQTNITSSTLSPSQAQTESTSSESDIDIKVATNVSVTSANIPTTPQSTMDTKEPETMETSSQSPDETFEALPISSNDIVDSVETKAEMLETHVIEPNATIAKVVPTQTQMEVEAENNVQPESSQQYTDLLESHYSTLDYSSDSVASTGSHPDPYKKLAELEEEMMRHDQDMLQRAGKLAPASTTSTDAQPAHIPPPTMYASQEGAPVPSPQAPQTAENNSYSNYQPPAPQLPIQEFYTAPTYEPTPPSSLAPAEGVASPGQKAVSPPAGSPSQYSTLASPHPFTRSHSQSSIGAPPIHPPLQGIRSSPTGSPRDPAPEPLPRKKKLPPPPPSKPHQIPGESAERSEAIRLSRMPTSNPTSVSPQQQENQGEAVSPSGQQMSKQTLLALSAIPKPRLTDNESWITKKKPESQRRDYSKHWLHQEAEQRRLEQQDRVNRQQQTRAPAPAAAKTLPPQSVSPQHPPHPQTTSYLPTYPPQNASPTYSSYPQALKNPSPVHSNNNNNNNNMWRNQATTYQPHMPTQAPNGDKALPDSIIHNITQRVNNKNSKNTYSNTNGRLGNTYGNNNYRDENYHDYMNADALSAPSTHTPLYQSGMGQSQQPPFNSQSQDHSSGQDQRLLSVSGKKKCSHCSEELGRGAAMIIESLRLFYHIPCFKCCVCGIQLGNGSAGADVRVRNHKLHCHNCYSNDEGMKFSKV